MTEEKRFSSKPKREKKKRSFSTKPETPEMKQHVRKERAKQAQKVAEEEREKEG